MEPQETVDRDPARVREMFGGIARRYDLLNHLLSANLDRGWRRATAARLRPEGTGPVLDLCGGTGDLTAELAGRRPGALVVCADFAHPMLLLANEKFRKRELTDRCLTLEADGLRLPFASATFDAVTVGFGIRNFADLGSGLREILRVLRPSGVLVVLEFSRPTGAVFSRLYRFYLHKLLPRLGDGLGRGRGAYGYLARTIGDFPEAPVLARHIREAGFAACEWSRRTAGIVAIHVGTKAGFSPPPSGAAAPPSAREVDSRPAER